MPQFPLPRNICSGLPTSGIVERSKTELIWPVFTSNLAGGEMSSSGASSLALSLPAKHCLLDKPKQLPSCASSCIILGDEGVLHPQVPDHRRFMSGLADNVLGMLLCWFSLQQCNNQRKCLKVGGRYHLLRSSNENWAWLI